MKHYLKVRIKTTKKTDVILKLNKINVDIKYISYEKDYLVLDLLKNDLKRVKKYLLSYPVEIIDEVGLYKIKDNLKKHSLFFISIIFAIVVFSVLSHVIIKVNIIHQNKDIREMLKSDLASLGVTPLSFKKSYQEYEEIINTIKNNHKDEIEWLEIDVDGMVINVRVEERILTTPKEEEGYCNIIASKSGIITSILTSRGVPIVGMNDYVEKDDLLITGEISLYDEVKNNVCAQGEVYAEVWYSVKTKYPLNYTEEAKTGKMRFNIMVKNSTNEYTILKSRVKEKTVQKIFLFKIFNYEVYLEKEYEVIRKDKTYSEEVALKKALDNVHNHLSVNASPTKKIINEKVLKKSVKNGNLDIEIFIALEEQIGVAKPYTKEMDSDTGDTRNNGNS